MIQLISHGKHESHTEKAKAVTLSKFGDGFSKAVHTL